MKGRIFLFNQERDRLIPMQEEPYLREEILQDWLSDYPELLPGDQINPENPRRWLLVKAEMGVPDHEGGSDRWSLDHLFLDQDGIPDDCQDDASTDTGPGDSTDEPDPTGCACNGGSSPWSASWMLTPLLLLLRRRTAKHYRAGQAASRPRDR